MSKTDKILETVEQLLRDFKTYNDMILPAIQQTINDQLQPVIEKQNDLERRLSELEKKVDNHINSK